MFETPIARLRDFWTGSCALVPTLVLPPQVGHDSCIVDYWATQSQMRTILGSGLGRAFSLDWVGATAETADAAIEDYLDVVDRAIEHCGGRANLIGDCQGGWLAAIYAALHPERVNTLTLAGAPVDFHAGEPVIHEMLACSRRAAVCASTRRWSQPAAACSRESTCSPASSRSNPTRRSRHSANVAPLRQRLTGPHAGEVVDRLRPPTMGARSAATGLLRSGLTMDEHVRGPERVDPRGPPVPWRRPQRLS